MGVVRGRERSSAGSTCRDSSSRPSKTCVMSRVTGRCSPSVPRVDVEEERPDAVSSMNGGVRASPPTASDIKYSELMRTSIRRAETG